MRLDTCPPPAEDVETRDWILETRDRIQNSASKNFGIANFDRPVYLPDSQISQFRIPSIKFRVQVSLSNSLIPKFLNLQSANLKFSLAICSENDSVH